ncbi:MAG: hypothetical protein FWD88_03275, partial [Treponema sp.]|nr:hypothetical protein [Treponema sp.]
MFPVAICTIGCRLNQIESEALADSFGKAGFALVPWPSKIEGPGIIIVNTCTVTSKAEQKTRVLIRKALRQNPDACVIVTGCYAKLDPLEIESLESECLADMHGTGAKRLFVPPGGEEGIGTAKSALLELPGHILDSAPCADGLPGIVGAWMALQGGACRDDGSPGGNAGGRDPFGFRPREFTFHSRG